MLIKDVDEGFVFTTLYFKIPVLVTDTSFIINGSK